MLGKQFWALSVYSLSVNKQNTIFFCFSKSKGFWFHPTAEALQAPGGSYLVLWSWWPLLSWPQFIILVILFHFIVLGSDPQDKHTLLLCQLCLPALTSQQGHWVGKVWRGFIIHVKLESFLKIKGWASPSLTPPEVITSYRITLLPSEVLWESPDSPLQGSTACSAERREWHGEVLGFLTPKVFLCTDCHFIGWGYLKSLSWCLSSLLGDTGSPRALCSLWFLLSEVFVWRK